MLVSCFCSIMEAKGIAQTIKVIDGQRYIVEPADAYELNEKVLLIKPVNALRDIPEDLKIIHQNQQGFLYVSVPDGMDVEEYAAKLRGTDKYEIVEFLGKGKYCLVPNDQYQGYQWHLNRINIYNAWNITTGSPDIKVAVIDSGVDAGHPDIGYGTDSYSNVSTSLGYDYMAHTAYQTPTNPHGTAVAGVIGAKTNNAVGVAGVSGGNNNAGITIVSYNLGNEDQFELYLADAILRATNIGAKVINLSLSTPETSDVASAIEYAYFHGISIVCSTSNAGQPYIAFPASSQYTIAVGATDQDDLRVEKASYGTGIDIVAPGKDIISLGLNSGYTSSTGTSVSAAQVSGVIALMLSVNPYLSPNEIRTILRNTATKIGNFPYDSNGWDIEVGYGLLNAYDAIIGAFQMDITGPDMVCSQEDYQISGLPYNDSNVVLNSVNSPSGFSISVSSNLNITSYSHGVITVQKVTNGNGFIKVYYKGNLIATKDFWVGVPVINGVYYSNSTIYIDTDSACQALDDFYRLVYNGTTYTLHGGSTHISIPNGTYYVGASARNYCGNSGIIYTYLVVSNGNQYNVTGITADGQARVIRVGRSESSLPGSAFPVEEGANTVPYTIMNSMTGKIVARGVIPSDGGEIILRNHQKGLYLLTIKPEGTKEESFKISL